MRKYLKLFFHPFTIILIITYLILGQAIGKKLYDNIGVKATHSRDRKMISLVEKQYKVSIDPDFKYSYDTMHQGVLQHLDRDYTYDIIPKELLGGVLFQGIHRPPKGIKVRIELRTPATVYYFFHKNVDGGYSRIFSNMENWKLCENAPKYDIHNGTHGLDMIMYKMEAKAGVYEIPPTTENNACFSIVFQPNR